MNDENDLKTKIKLISLYLRADNSRGDLNTCEAAACADMLRHLNINDAVRMGDILGLSVECSFFYREKEKAIGILDQVKKRFDFIDVEVLN